jgi:hypothetical protein
MDFSTFASAANAAAANALAQTIEMTVLVDTSIKRCLIKTLLSLWCCPFAHLCLLQ